MTITIKSDHIGDYYVMISQEKFSSSYQVSLNWSPSGVEYRTLDERTYFTIESANRRYRTLLKRCKEEGEK